VLKVSVPTFKF
jgi:hypothetical protein